MSTLDAGLFDLETVLMDAHSRASNIRDSEPKRAAALHREIVLPIALALDNARGLMSHPVQPLD